MTLSNRLAPTPPMGWNSYDYFGFALAPAGSDCVIIGAYQDDLVAIDTGAAYLYRTTGALLVTLTNPTPALNDWFGFAVKGVGSQRVVIGAPNDDTGMADAGVTVPGDITSTNSDYSFADDGTAPIKYYRVLRLP